VLRSKSLIVLYDQPRAKNIRLECTGSNPYRTFSDNCSWNPNVSDSNLEATNLVDVGDRLADALWKLARTGNPDAIGTLEAHGEAMKEAAHITADAIMTLANAIRRRA